MTSSQVPTQPQRTNDTPTIRMQPVAAAREPAWPTAEPMTATNLSPVAAATTKFEPVTGASNGTLNGYADGKSNGTANGTTNGSANGTPNGTANGSINGVLNGTSNGTANGSPATPPAFSPAADSAPAPSAFAPASVVPAAAAPGPAAAESGVEPARAPAAKQTPPATPRSRLRRIARRIVGPTLLTKKG
ncbi:hypothetical protein [Saccharothrix carnea]|uniref:hypothetical protein n=1 Tax=Saccharothrix carnea TaxID=1280637 RepID=UPI0015E74F2A|nr:hypothetical protein [Saccharothrix carnea]